MPRTPALPNHHVNISPSNLPAPLPSHVSAKKSYILPVPHYMACAPLDAWLRLLTSPGSQPALLALPRLLLNLILSTLATLITLPERIILGLTELIRGTQPINRHAVVVLGYYRSGTTHLQYLLSCDPRFITPKWYHVLAPQGWLFTWSLFRLLLVPFMGEKRPIDDVAYGPEWPTEDEFALANWTNASPLAGRMTFPNEKSYQFHRRFHFLENVSDSELSRWKGTMRSFLWKLSLLHPTRSILLKTPAHTARVRHLASLFAPGHIKFIHISREPAAVLESNLSINQRFDPYLLQSPADLDTLRTRITSEYAQTMEALHRDRAALSPRTITDVRFEDLHADPLGELKRIYTNLGLDYSPELEQRFVAYLTAVKGHKPRTNAAAKPLELPEALQFIRTRFGHDRPAVASHTLPPVRRSSRSSSRSTRLTFALVFMPILVGVLWAIYSASTQLRQEWLVWPSGILIGWLTLWAVRRGTATFGIIAAIITALLWCALTFTNTYTVTYDVNPHPELAVSFTDEIIPQTFNQFAKPRSLIWGTLGVLTAYRFASRRHVHPLGKDALD